ncbi:MAG TPA: recombinase family protein [Bacillota bacterium]|nr:recombinase family protein [Bacillota bacterium]
MIVAIYARISLLGGDSVAHQVALLKEVVRSRGLGQCPEEFIYEDSGVSATRYSIWTRPAMKQLLADANAGKFQIVIFKGISRFARSTQEALDVLERLKAQGLRVISYEENYDSQKENSNFMFTMHAAIAEYEAEKTGIRVRLGNKAKTQGGQWCGSAPDGYKLVEKRLAIDEARRGIIQQIFTLYAEGMGSFRVAELLNRQGQLTSTGGLWCAKTVRDVLRNQAYTGAAVYNKTRQRRVRDYNSGEEGKKKWVRQANPAEEWVIKDDAHQAIIHGELFDRVQTLLRRHGTRVAAPRASHLLTGLLYCGKCGAGMVCQKRSAGNRTYRYYICKTYHKYGREHCSQANTNAELLEKEVLGRLAVKLRQLVPGLRPENCLTVVEGDVQDLEKQLREIRRKLARVNRDTADLYFQRHSMSAAQYSYIAKQLKEQSQRLLARQGELVTQLEEKREKDSLLEAIRQSIRAFPELDQMKTEQLRKLLPRLINRLELTGISLNIHYTFDFNARL